jgi:methylmalonyl-CoA mutase N-terminal domain/subunit
MNQVDELGGAVAAIEQGFQKREIERSAYAVAKQIDSGQRVVVGVNRYVLDTEEPYEPLRVDPAIEVAQRDRLGKLARRTRCDGRRQGPRWTSRGCHRRIKRAVSHEGRVAGARDRR